MEEAIEMNDRRGLKRPAEIEKLASAISENVLNKFDPSDDNKEDVIKRWKSCSAPPKQGTI